MKEIERAIEIIKQGLELPDNEIFHVRKTYEICLEALQEKLDRQENKALTLSELKEMVGEPVWVQFKTTIDCVIIVSIMNETIEVFSKHGKIFLYFSDGNYYKHKPNGGE